jgi:hypothetical protein
VKFAIDHWIYLQIKMPSQRWEERENKELKYQSLFSVYEPIHQYRIYYVNRESKEEEVQGLIEVANRTWDFIIDTESDYRSNTPALIQIMMLQEIQEQSPLILFEMQFIPSPSSSLYVQIRKLFQSIFRQDVHAYCWGSLTRELRAFHRYELVPTSLKCYVHDVQATFKKWFNDWVNSSQVEGNNLDDIDDALVIQAPNYDPELFISPSVMNDIKMSRNQLWGLQDAIAYLFSQYLSKRDTLQKWSIGLDIRLHQNRQKISSKHRQKLVQYAAFDGLSVAQIMMFMYEYRVSQVNREDRTHQSLGEYFLSLKKEVFFDLDKVHSKCGFIFDEDLDDEDAEDDEMAVHDKNERQEISSCTYQQVNQDFQEEEEQQQVKFDHQYQQIDQQEEADLIVPVSSSKAKRSMASKKKRNQKSSLRHRKNRYNYEIIRSVNMDYSQVKRILRRRAVPYKNINIIKSKLYIGVKNQAFEDYYERLLSPDLFN